MSRISATALFLAMFVVLPAPVQAINIYRVGGEIQAKAYVEVLKKWVDRSFSIWVGVDGKTKHVFFKGQTGLKEITVRNRYDKGVQQRLERIASKGIEWSEVARKNAADTRKGLDCFGSDPDGWCRKDGNASDANQMGVSFFAANYGRQTDLILDMIDRDNQFYTVQLYLEPAAFGHLKSTIAMIPDAFKQAEKTAKNQQLFK